jgi:EpsI family protein
MSTPSSSNAALPIRNFGEVPLWRSAMVAGLALLMGLTYVFNPPSDVLPQAGVIMELPVILGNYLGKQGAITKVEYDLLPKDTEFARRYYDDGHGHQINCSIVLSGAEQRSIHRPEGCLTGQGWTIVGQDTIPLALISGRTMQARRLTLERQVVGQNKVPLTVRAYYIYWFVGQNVTTSSEIYRVLLSNWDRVVHNRANRWAYVSVFSLITAGLEPNGLDDDQTETMLKDFLRQIVPTFQISEMPAQARD